MSASHSSRSQNVFLDLALTPAPATGRTPPRAVPRAPAPSCVLAAVLTPCRALLIKPSIAMLLPPRARPSARSPHRLAYLRRPASLPSYSPRHSGTPHLYAAPRRSLHLAAPASSALSLFVPRGPRLHRPPSSPCCSCVVPALSSIAPVSCPRHTSSCRAAPRAVHHCTASCLATPRSSSRLVHCLLTPRCAPLVV